MECGGKSPEVTQVNKRKLPILSSCHYAYLLLRLALMEKIKEGRLARCEPLHSLETRKRIFHRRKAASVCIKTFKEITVHGLGAMST